MDENPAEQGTAELAVLQEDTDSFLAKRLVIWAIRWTIGFAIIAAVDYFYDGVGWLWWTGGAVAAASLILMLVMQRITARKFAQVEDKLEALRDM